MHGKKRETAERLLDGADSAARLDADALRELLAGLDDVPSSADTRDSQCQV
ncbi:MAG: hypothetical protein KF718_08855 [Polyangiaceae bacterium]|nr:hypothetical protein [Polyangiaceae bacterium]